MAKYTHMHVVEVQLAKRWREEDDMGVGLIARLFTRCPETANKHVFAERGALQVEPIDARDCPRNPS